MRLSIELSNSKNFNYEILDNAKCGNDDERVSYSEISNLFAA